MKSEVLTISIVIIIFRGCVTDVVVLLYFVICIIFEESVFLHKSMSSIEDPATAQYICRCASRKCRLFDT